MTRLVPTWRWTGIFIGPTQIESIELRRGAIQHIVEFEEREKEMLHAIKEKVTIKRGGVVEIRRPELIEGTEAEVIVVIEAPPTPDTLSLDDLPVDHLGPWPVKLSLRREDLYDDEGR